MSVIKALRLNAVNKVSAKLKSGCWQSNNERSIRLI